MGHRLYLLRHSLCKGHHPTELIGSEIEEVVDLPTRHYKRVSRLYGVDVEEGVELAILRYLVRRDLPFDDACEECSHLDGDIEYLKVQETTRGLYLDDIPYLAAHEPLCDGGVDRDLLLLEVSLRV